LKLTDWKNETPPPHIEGKRICRSDHNDSDNEPHQCKPPEQDADEQTDKIEGIACTSYMWNGTDEWKDVFGNLS
jgi:hypothetical protein